MNLETGTTFTSGAQAASGRGQQPWPAHSVPAGQPAVDEQNASAGRLELGQRGNGQQCPYKIIDIRNID
jgi:hypothetical protein